MKNEAADSCRRGLTDGKFREIALYVIFGALTTAVNFAVYFLARISLSVRAAQTVAWTAAVAFAFVTNKIFVFRSRRRTAAELFRELFLFFGARIFSGVFEFAGLFLLVNENTGRRTEAAVKFFVTALVIVLNYILSKLVVFSKRLGGRRCG